MRWSLVLFGFAALAFGCSTTVDTTGGAGGSGGTTTTTTTGPCTAHADCEDGICIFSSGTCSTMCGTALPCPKGAVCDECATSSCPDCEDCNSACVPAQDGQCDDHQDCAAGELCQFLTHQCTAACTGDADCKISGDYCNPCGTYSCSACDDCMSACTFKND